ncbi:HNH endonuclease [Streptomyces sp. NPDC053780]|uniref:HNH endonuclease n=1 Tax=unclassified Streptomyces TaxID=2593676 RepID=UPI0034397265
MAKVEKSESGCWVWTAFRSNGYGKFNVNGRMVRAHRWMLEYTLGRELSPDEVACHTCDNPSCVNPGHLYVGDYTTNRLDVTARGRRPSGFHAECGHPETPNERKKCRQANGTKQSQRHGLTPYERFMSYVDAETTPDGCHPWTGRAVKGRGKFLVQLAGRGREQYYATRWLMEHTLGRELEPGELVRHKCDNPICVRRDHLELGTAADNSRDIVERGRHHNAAKTHCKWGHPFDETNTYVQPSTGKRQCRVCRRTREHGLTTPA